MPNGKGRDMCAAHNFLDMLKFLRHVGLQDAACMIVQGRDHVLFRRHPVFRSALFQQYVENMRVHLEEVQTTPQAVHANINQVHPGIGTELSDMRQKIHVVGIIQGQTHAMAAQSLAYQRQQQADIAEIRVNSAVAANFVKYGITGFNGSAGNYGSRFRPPPPPPPHPQELGQWTWIPNNSNTSSGGTNSGIMTGPPTNAPRGPTTTPPPPPPSQRQLAMKQYKTAEEVYQDYNSRFVPIVQGSWTRTHGYSANESKNIRRIGLLVHYAQGR
jgi:hypothetical protein